MIFYLHLFIKYYVYIKFRENRIISFIVIQHNADWQAQYWLDNLFIFFVWRILCAYSVITTYNRCRKIFIKAPKISIFQFDLHSYHETLIKYFSPRHCSSSNIIPYVSLEYFSIGVHTVRTWLLYLVFWHIPISGIYFRVTILIFWQWSKLADMGKYITWIHQNWSYDRNKRKQSTTNKSRVT